jgi:NitT/TauT family transport system substrate-binding protein
MKATFFLSLILFTFSTNARTIRVGSSPVTSSAAIYLAQERGYFKEQGLEVEITDFNNSGAPMTLLLSKGELDVGAGNITAGLFNAITQGEKFKIVADKGYIDIDKNYLGLVVRQEHITSGRYKTLKDLKGFKMGLTSLEGVSQEILTEKFLQSVNLKLEDVTFIKLAYSEMNLALKSGAIDATIQIEPFLTKVEIDGIAKKVALASDVYPGQQSGVILYSPKFIKEHNNDAQKFMIAYAKGIEAYNNAFVNKIDKNIAINDLKKVFKYDDVTWEKMSNVGLNQYGKLNTKELTRDIKWYEKRYVKKTLNVNEIIDESFWKFAKKSLNKK